jgi:hypothetical protein
MAGALVVLAFTAVFINWYYYREIRSSLDREFGIRLRSIASLEAPRCCQRDLWLAFRAAEAISAELLPIRLRAETPLRCTQAVENRECIGSACPVMKQWRDRNPRSIAALENT